jgi:hypothetical protein
MHTGRVMMAVRKDQICVQNMSVQHSNGELIEVLLENVNGRYKR